MKTQRPTQLAWLAQAALIVLPVVILSGVALHFLREDKTAIEKDARDRANSVAPAAARRIGDEISAFLRESRKKGLLTEGEVVDGQGYARPDYFRLPEPADWAAKLKPSDRATARANAQLDLLIAGEPHSDAAPLIRRAIGVAQQWPVEVTESGTPVADLALILAIRHLAKGNLPPELVTAIENDISLHPSFLSMDMVDALATVATTDSGRSDVARLRADWLKQESGRQRTRYQMQDFGPRLALASRSRPGNAPTLLYWNDRSRKPGGPPVPHAGLALCAPQREGWRIAVVRLEPLRRALHVELPDYMGAWLNVAGEQWPLGARTPPVRIASSKGTFGLDANYPFTLFLYVANSKLLYAPYRRRLLLIQWLIFAAAAASLLGLWRLWQTYRDQTRLSEMKSNLVSSVSHELRAPLAAVRLMVESLESGRVDGVEKQKDYYRLIVRECRRLSSLVENALDFSRIDRGSKQYHPEPLDALALLRHTVMLMEPGAAEHEVRLRLIEPPADFENLQPSWDSEAIEQSLVNLVDNAIKHSPAGAEVTVEVELLPAVVRFWVNDSGPGIPVGEHQKIFDLFYRCGSELRRETEGAGIGLSIVKHAAEAHGGRVIVESVVGRGSRFGLELPR